MAIIFDYKDIGARYEQLSGSWFPVKDKVKDKAALNADYGPIASDDRIRSVVDRIKDRFKNKGNQLNDPYNGRFVVKDVNSFQYEYKQVFDRYRRFVMTWASHSDYLDPITGLTFDHIGLDYELAYLEKQHGIIDEGDRFRFRLEFVNWIYSQDDPQWDANPKYKAFIEAVTASLMLPKLLPMTS